ncbi:MAG: hypothetical protein ABW321_06790 [Polyangiales bacterium]
MAKNIVFLVHGMGKHFASQEPDQSAQTAWDSHAVRTLDTAWKRFPALANTPREELIEYVPITYDQIFREYLQEVGDDAERLRRYMPTQELKDVLEVLEGASDAEAAFFWSHIADVLDYRYGADRFRYVHAHICRTIVEKVQAVWARPGHENATFSVIAHSLGTAAVHGALNRLGGGNIGQSAQFRVGGLFQLRSYISIANVSRVLWYGEQDMYRSTIVRPFTPDLGRGYCDQFINVRHIADPIVAPQPFAPADWGHAYRELAVRHVRAINVHDLSHYLDHPLVSGSIFRAVLGGDAFLTREELNAQVSAYPDVVHSDPAQRQQVERLINDLSSALQQVYGSDQALLWSIPRLFALLLRTLFQHREALRPLLAVV